MRRSGLFFCFLFLFAAGARANHPFDPRRYAYELFSEDEIALSKYAGKMDEAVVISMLEQSWAELDTAAARAADLRPEEAKSAIREAVRGTGGISEKFDQRMKLMSTASARETAPAQVSVKQAIRYPLLASIVILFALALFWINRKKQ